VGGIATPLVPVTKPSTKPPTRSRPVISYKEPDEGMGIPADENTSTLLLP